MTASSFWRRPTARNRWIRHCSGRAGLTAASLSNYRISRAAKPSSRLTHVKSAWIQMSISIPLPVWLPVPPVQNWPISSTKRLSGPCGITGMPSVRLIWKKVSKWSSQAIRRRMLFCRTKKSGPWPIMKSDMPW